MKTHCLRNSKINQFKIVLGSLVLFVFCSAAEAQWDPSFLDVSQAVSLAQQPCNSQPSKLTIPKVTVYERYGQTRRDREQEVLVAFCAVKNENGKCPPIAIQDRGDFIPISLELESKEGFTVRYREGEKYKIETAAAATPGTPGFFLKVRPRKDVPLGEQTLHGKLRFRQGKRVAGETLQQIEVTIPLNVAEHHANVKESDAWLFKQPNHAWQNVRLALAMPLIIPAAALILLTCGVMGCDDL